ncbi:MAG: PTS sugar transporter subunit IIA [Thermodesulfobacteriota bacterium]|nr:MAG: PTS sugar transporter subunit IIA [Thermodesulfobacteriota bacterium]
MRLVDVLKKEYILPDLKARDKKELLSEMVTYLAQKVPALDREKTLQALFERERLGTTGIGHGVALPHGKMKGIDEIRVFFARSKEGVDFNSIDNSPVHLFFLIIAPENSAAAHLKLLACISRILKNQNFRSQLMDASNPSVIFKLIAEADTKNTTKS